MNSRPSSYWPGAFSLWGPPGPGGCAGDYGEFAGQPCFEPVKECVKKYKACYKLYRISALRLYKVCSRCGCEFDYYQQRGCCPHCY